MGAYFGFGLFLAVIYAAVLTELSEHKKFDYGLFPPLLVGGCVLLLLFWPITIPASLYFLVRALVRKALAKAEDKNKIN